MDQQAPVMVIHPRDTTICAGNNERVMEAIAANAPTSFQWRRNNQPIPGADGPDHIVVADILLVAQPEAAVLEMDQGEFHAHQGDALDYKFPM